MVHDTHSSLKSWSTMQITLTLYSYFQLLRALSYCKRKPFVNLFEFHYFVINGWCWVVNYSIEMCRLRSESYSEVVKISDNKEFKNSWINPEKSSSFVPNAPFLCPLRTSENRKFFWCFQKLEKRCIGNKWVKETERIVSLQNVL